MDDETARAISAMVQPLHESQTRLLVAATLLAPFLHHDAQRMAANKTNDGWSNDRATRRDQIRAAISIADEFIAESKIK